MPNYGQVICARPKHDSKTRTNKLVRWRYVSYESFFLRSGNTWDGVAILRGCPRINPTGAFPANLSPGQSCSIQGAATVCPTVVVELARGDWAQPHYCNPRQWLEAESLHPPAL